MTTASRPCRRPAVARPDAPLLQRPCSTSASSRRPARKRSSARCSASPRSSWRSACCSCASSRRSTRSSPAATRPKRYQLAVITDHAFLDRRADVDRRVRRRAGRTRAVPRRARLSHPDGAARLAARRSSAPSCSRCCSSPDCSSPARTWPSLDRDHAVSSVWSWIWTFVGLLVLVEPGDDLLAVGGVDHHRPAVGPAVDEHVVADAALLVADQAVADLEVLHRGGVVGVDVLDQVERVRPAEREPAHVADVEQPGGGADGLCSSMMVVYCTGMSQPAKSTMRAPWATCQSCSTVRRPATGDLRQSHVCLSPKRKRRANGYRRLRFRLGRNLVHEHPYRMAAKRSDQLTR